MKIKGYVLGLIANQTELESVQFNVGLAVQVHRLAQGAKIQALNLFLLLLGLFGSTNLLRDKRRSFLIVAELQRVVTLALSD
jgi:hypothetical protein